MVLFAPETKADSIAGMSAEALKNQRFFFTQGRSLYRAEATPENLEKLTHFLKQEYPRQGLGYPSRSQILAALATGYFMLWEPDKGFEALRQDTEQNGLHPSLLGLELSKLSYARTTETNHNRLVRLAYMHVEKMNPSLLPAFTRALIHFGERKTGVSSNDSPLTSGRIRGSLKLQGKSLTAGKVGLFAKDYCFVSSGILHGNGLVDAHVLESDGSFAFQNLGEGEYFLALWSDTAALPQGVVLVQNNPGLLKLDNETPEIALPPIELSLPERTGYDEAKVRYLLAAFQIKWPDVNYEGFPQLVSDLKGLDPDPRKQENNLVEAMRCWREGVRVEQDSVGFEQQDLGWVINHKPSGKPATGREVRLSTDTPPNP